MKINSIHFGGGLLAAGLAGLAIPGLIRLLGGPFYPGLLAIGGGLLLLLAVLLLIEHRQDTAPAPYYEKTLAKTVPYDPETQLPVIRVSVCTGERVAGFRDRSGSRFAEAMLIRTPEDLDRFRKLYGLEHTAIKTEY